MCRFSTAVLGWHRDFPDIRDIAADSLVVQAMLQRCNRPKPARTIRPSRIDWREYCPPIRDQGKLASCTAHACLGLFEYFERRSFGKVVDASRLFVHQTTRRLLQRNAQPGANLRTTFKAMIRFGVPPEQFWPYDTDKSELEPEPFLFSFAQHGDAIKYVRLDPRGSNGGESLMRVKSFLVAGLPCVLGFIVCDSISNDPGIAFPTRHDSVRGGHSVLAIGYDDSYRIRSTKGALLIQNSWGTAWGDKGYGWLPYAYVEEQLAVDCWTIMRSDWLDTGEFARPR